MARWHLYRVYQTMPASPSDEPFKQASRSQAGLDDDALRKLKSRGGAPAHTCRSADAPPPMPFGCGVPGSGGAAFGVLASHMAMTSPASAFVYTTRSLSRTKSSEPPLFRRVTEDGRESNLRAWADCNLSSPTEHIKPPCHFHHTFFLARVPQTPHAAGHKSSGPTRKRSCGWE